MIYAARLRRIALTCLLAAVVIWTLVAGRNQQPPVPADRKEVIFWHEWGGEDRAVVEEIIDPRDTRPLLCEFAELAWRKLGAA